MKRNTFGAGLVTLLLAACSPAQPSGQVLAQVGDVAITRRDVAAELTAAGFGGDVDASTRQAVLGKLVERALLVRQAHRQRLDRSPDYLAAQRRSRDLILLGLLTQEVAGREPRPRDVAAFVAAHPWMFARRQIVTVDSVAPAAGRLAAAAIATQPSPDALATLLATRRVPFVRRTMQLDTGLLLPDSARRLAESRNGDVLPLRHDGTDALVRAVARVEAGLVGQRATDVARAVMRRRAEARRLTALLENERARTPVRYQQGFGLTR